MSIRVTANFADPTQSQVTLTMTAPLGDFEQLRAALSSEKPVPYWQVQSLLQQIDAASRALRGTVHVETPPPPPRKMILGDIYPHPGHDYDHE